MTKKVTAPKTYDPGKGRPKEHLAYLNEREMAYLRSINGNNMERGPRNLPSFPPDDALGSSSKAGTKSSTSTTKSSGPSMGAGGQRGAGSNYGPGSGRPGTTSSSGNSRVGDTSSGQRGAGSNYGPGSASPGTSTSGGYKGPASPMGGQGTSFSRDSLAQQKTQVRDAIAAVRNTPAFRGDAVSGGIRTINVGPMQTPVKVGGKVDLQRTSIADSISKARPSTSISAQFPSYKYDRPLTPGMTPEDMALRGATMERIAQEMRDLGLINKTRVTPTGSPIAAGGIPTTSPPAPFGRGKGTYTYDKMESLKPSGFLAPDDVSVPPPIDFGPYGPVQPEERILAIEDVPMENETIVNKTPAAAPKAPFTRFGTREGLGLRGATTYGITSYEPGDYAAYRASLEGVDDGIPRDENGNIIGPETPRSSDMTTEDMVRALRPSGKTRGLGPTAAETWENTPYGEPGTQARQKGIVEKALRHVPGAVGLLTKGYGWVEDKRIAGMTADERLAQQDKWNQMNKDYLSRSGTDNDRKAERGFGDFYDTTSFA